MAISREATTRWSRRRDTLGPLRQRAPSTSGSARARFRRFFLLSFFTPFPESTRSDLLVLFADGRFPLLEQIDFTPSLWKPVDPAGPSIPHLLPLFPPLPLLTRHSSSPFVLLISPTRLPTSNSYQLSTSSDRSSPLGSSSASPSSMLFSTNGSRRTSGSSRHYGMLGRRERKERGRGRRGRRFDKVPADWGGGLGQDRHDLFAYLEIRGRHAVLSRADICRGRS
jgi:hypothetical protein